MHLISITLRNYRVHRETTVQFNSDVTLIGGPNECGKSTLIEAVHHALFVKAKGASETHRNMESHCHPGAPEVELVFSAGGQNHTLLKKFGSTGKTTLVGPRVPLSDSDAEQELAALLKVEQQSNAKWAVEQWSHLWVWQGASGENPGEHANAEAARLLQRLQQQGAAGILRSPLDDKVFNSFAKQHDAIFNKDGSPKAGSDLSKFRSLRNEAEETFQQARTRVEDLENTVEEYHQAVSEIATARQAAGQLEIQLSANREKEAALAILEQELKIKEAHLDRTRETFDFLVKVEQTIKTLRADIERLKTALNPRQAQLQTFEASLQHLKVRERELARDHSSLAEQVRTARLERDLADICLKRFEKATAVSLLEKRVEDITEATLKVTHLQKELNALPAIRPKQLDLLREAERTLQNCDATIKAIATGIEILEAGGELRIGNDPAKSGQTYTITNETEISVGESIKLRIKPGGSASLREAEDQREEARRALQKQLDDLGITSLDQADQACTRVLILSEELKFAQRSLKNFKPEETRSELADLQSDLNLCLAEVERRASGLTGFNLPADVPGARRLLADKEKLLEELEKAEKIVRKDHEAISESLTTNEESIISAHGALQEEEDALRELNASLGVRLSEQGDDRHRATKLAEADTVHTTAKAIVGALARQIEDMQPELLRSETERYVRSLEAWKKTEQAAREKKAGAERILRSDGNEDPNAALENAAAQLEYCRQQEAQAERKAEAIRMLKTLFEKERQALADRFTEPLVRRVTGYLQCIFGPRARAYVRIENDKFSGISVEREGMESGRMGFEQLSGGAREQVAAAFRLAICEVLAADHHDRLPIVFDDAFAYSDPDRVRLLQRMLDLAIRRGLQVIILTCNPADYTALPVQPIILRRSLHARPMEAVRTIPAPAATELPPAEHNISPEMSAKLLSMLATSFSGKAPNAKLRETLRWDETTFNAVRQQLIATGELLPGRGQGGSVRLPELEAD